jgi:triosephosphate isomerase
MRKKIIGANWKMNLSLQEARTLFQAITTLQEIDSTVDLVIFPPQVFTGLLQPSSTVKLGAQNAFGPALSGAYTGETSLKQLQDINVSSVIVGHSERRMLFNENSDFLCEKALTALSMGFQVFFCCGESDEVRSKGMAISYVREQLKPLLSLLNLATCASLVIAYEPIWAIGTGKIPTLSEIEEIHTSIRELLNEYMDEDHANSIRIVYGGSCNASNAKSIFQLPNVDGGLVGGASLELDSMKEIIASI